MEKSIIARSQRCAIRSREKMTESVLNTVPSVVHRTSGTEEFYDKMAVFPGKTRNVTESERAWSIESVRCRVADTNLLDIFVSGQLIGKGRVVYVYVCGRARVCVFSTTVIRSTEIGAKNDSAIRRNMVLCDILIAFPRDFGVPGEPHAHG